MYMLRYGESPLQSFSQDYGLTLVFIREWRNLQFNIDSERQIFEKLFHGSIIYSHGVFLSTTKSAFYLKKM